MDKLIEVLRKFRIGVLAGGESSEREISLKSGKAVFEALRKAGLDPLFLDVNEKDFSSVIEKSGIDAAFIALHGRFGEDGTVQRMLQKRNIPYTGSGPDASALALDKMASKEQFIARGLNVPEYIVVYRGEDISELDVWFPCVVKPRFEGSSIGLSVVSSETKLHQAIDNAFMFGEEVIVERFVPGREITVGILDEKALPVVEIVAHEGVYDFDAKYRSDSTEYVVPAKLDESDSRFAQETALEAHKALGCKGFSRVDMRLSDNHEIFVLEVNTIPGLTERSLLPMAAKAAGLDFPGLCVKMLLVAFEKRKTK